MPHDIPAADRRLRAVAARQDWVVTAVQAHRVGLSDADIRLRCLRGEWRALLRGTYLLDPDCYAGGKVPRRTLIRAGLLSAGPAAVAVRETAAELLGLPFVPTSGEIHVAVPGAASRHSRAHLAVHQMTVPLRYRTNVDGMPCTTVVRTMADTLLAGHRDDAVAMVDAALNRGLLAPADLDGVRLQIAGRPGCVTARRILAECDGRAQSPAESRVRLICRDGQVPAPELQYPIHDRHGVLLGTADLAWPTRRLAAEVDGTAPHSQPAALYRDRHRQNDFALAGWTTIRFTWADTFRPGYVVATVRTALRTVGS